MNNYFQFRFFTAIACVMLFASFTTFVNAAQSDNDSSASNLVGKLYVLSIWGTNADDLHNSLEQLQHRFVFTMQVSGLNLESEFDPDKFVKEFVLLSGDKASKQNVLETCRSISQRAQKNDVIFVYMCCHGITKCIDGSNKRHHVLFPGIKSVDQMQDIEKYGIIRSELIKALSPEKHRLVALITDAGTRSQDEQVITRQPDNPNVVVCYDPGYLRRKPSELNPLRIFLQTNSGLVDWNSTSPLGGKDGQGEQSPLFQMAQEHEGVFFMSLMSFTIENNNPISKAAFFNDLKNRLSNNYEFNAKIEDNKKSNAIFTNQPTQSLFDFNGQGYVTEKPDKSKQ